MAAAAKASSTTDDTETKGDESAEVVEVETVTTAYSLGQKVRERHLNEAGVINCIAINEAGVWYYVTTVSGMSIGWWHETDIAGAPKTLPPSEKTAV